MAHVLTVLSNGAVLLFVVTTMLAMGLSLTVSQILAPLRRVRLVVLALVANFVLVPLLAFALTHLIPLSEPLKIGLILLGAAAGAPFLPKLAQFAHGNVAFSVGLMVLLMVVRSSICPGVAALAARRQGRSALHRRVAGIDHARAAGHRPGGPGTLPGAGRAAPASHGTSIKHALLSGARNQPPRQLSDSSSA